MGITNETIPKLKNCYKYNEPVLNLIQNYKNIPKDKPHKPIEYRKYCSFLKKLKRYEIPPISNETINLFYENPKEFFSKYEQLLDNTSFYDDSGYSIFAHYFHALNDLFNKNNGENKDNIYVKNFENFFKKEEKYLSIQDFSLETPLHKIAKNSRRK